MICGIDVGLNGGIAFMAEEGALLSFEPLPTVSNEISCKDLTNTLSLCRQESSMVFIEHAQSMPKQGVSSTFKYGMGFGMVIGVVAALGIPYTLVKPRAWQKVMHVGTDSDLHPKLRSLVAVERLFPIENFIATPRSKKPHDGIIDAVLIAEYGRRSLMKGDV